MPRKKGGNEDRKEFQREVLGVKSRKEKLKKRDKEKTLRNWRGGGWKHRKKVTWGGEMQTGREKRGL